MDTVNEIETTRREITERINCDDYDDLCKLLISREEHDYRQIKKDVLDISFVKTVEKIEELQKNGIKLNCTDRFIEENLTVLTDGLMANLLTIYQSALSNLDDPNILGFINIFMFQCSIMFSKHEGHLDLYREILKIRVKKNGKYSYLTLLDYLTSTNWLDYNTIKTFLLGNDKNILAPSEFRHLVEITKNWEITKKEYTVENIQDNPTEALFLIKYMKHYGSTQLVPDYLNRVYYIELVSETQLADNNCTTSIEYLFHDIAHAANSLYTCLINIVDINEVKEFYTFLEQQFNSNNLTKDKFDKIRVFIYYEIHEGYCFLRTETSSSIELNNNYYRLFRFGDLLGLVPGLVRNAKKN